MCGWHLRHQILSQCSGSISHAVGDPQGPHNSHWSIQLQFVCHGSSGGQSAGCLYDCQRLARDPAGRPCPWVSSGTSWLIHLSSESSFGNVTTSSWGRVSFTEKLFQKGSMMVLFQPVLPATHRETTLEGSHDEIGHLGLKWMLDLMCDCFFWPQMAVQAKNHVKKCCKCITFKAKQQKAPMVKL